MLSNHLQGRAADHEWSPLPRSSPEDDPGVVASAAAEADAEAEAEASVESLDYEIIENYAYREEQAQKRGRLCTGYSMMVKWFFSLLIGIGTALAAVFINLAVENFAGWKFSATFAIIQTSYLAGFIVYALINLSLVFSSVYIVTQFAPAAAGSGIPEIKGYLNGVDAHGILLFRTLVGKIFGSIGSVGGGLALGKEGPLVHTGACIASLIGHSLYLELPKVELLCLELTIGRCIENLCLTCVNFIGRLTVDVQLVLLLHLGLLLGEFCSLWRRSHPGANPEFSVESFYKIDSVVKACSNPSIKGCLFLLHGSRSHQAPILQKSSL